MELQIALQPEALLGKSKAYMARAFAAKNREDFDEYQLWASLALELLGKSFLAGKHPSLIVDPNHPISLFAASGLNIGTDIKTIGSHTLYERLRHLVQGFDAPVKVFCDAISRRRNAELHSGEVPFRGMRLESWEARYWHAAQLILEEMGLTLEEWLGAQDAKAPKELLEHALEAKLAAAKMRIDQARTTFSERPKAEREALLAQAEGKTPGESREMLALMADAYWTVTCPACGGHAVMAGIQYWEEVTDEADEEEPWVETVEKGYGAEELYCPACALHLRDVQEVEAAGFDEHHTLIETREREYEPDYGND